MASRHVSRVVYRDPLRDHPDQLLFFVLFVVGAAAIWTLKSYGFSQFVATAVPVGLMLLYALVVWVTKQYRLREDRAGDNIYYLGFLYTLVSLAYALYTYRPDGDAAADIITNFGIAIFTTIIGLAGRVFFSQMREDPVEYEREARYSLAEATNAMRAQLGDISSEAAIFKRKLAQVLEEGVSETAQLACLLLGDNIRQYGETSTAVLEKVDDAFEQFARHSARFDGMAAQSITALERLLAGVEQIRISPELVSEKFDPVLAVFKDAAEETARNSRRQTKDLKRVAAMMEATASSMKELHERTEALHRTLASTLDGAAQQMRRTGDAAATLTQSLAASQKIVEGTDGDALGLAQLLRRETLAANEAFASLRRTLDADREASLRARSEVEEDLALARQHRAEAARMLTESRQAYQELEESLVSLARTMIEQLSDG